MNEKSPDAFRTISEVADELDLPQHVLRFWETKFAAIRPMKRGGGRRYYRPSDVNLLKGIRHLLYSEGYTIKGVQKILKDQGNRFVAELATDVERGVTLSLSPAEPGESAPEPDDSAHDDIVLTPKLRASAGASRDARLGPSHATGLGSDAVSQLKRVVDELKLAREALQRMREG